MGLKAFRVQRLTLAEALQSTIKIEEVEPVQNQPPSPPTTDAIAEGETNEEETSLAQEVASEPSTIPVQEEEKIESTFKLTPTIYIKGQDDEKLSISGWKIWNFEAISASIQACTVLTHLSYTLQGFLLNTDYGTAVWKRPASPLYYHA